MSTNEVKRQYKSESEYTNLKHQAAILFIKEFTPLRTITEKLNVPINQLSAWSIEGKWMDLRGEPQKVINPKQRESQILYTKHLLTEMAISEKLSISMPTLTRWKKSEAWDELRPDIEIINRYKAAAMYVEGGMTENEISQKVGVSEVTVKMWADLYGWKAARLVNQANNVIVECVDDFCAHFKTMFSHYATEIELVRNDYVRSIAQKAIDQNI